MTTIAANRECMAGDQRMTDAGPFGHTLKIQRIGLSLFGMCGEAHRCHVLLEWLKTPQRNRPQLYKAFADEDGRYAIELMEISPGGIFLWNGWGVPLPILDKHWAIGSGAMAAMAAMKAGHDPEEAVRIAAQLDEATGPPIQVEYLKQPKRKR